MTNYMDTNREEMIDKVIRKYGFEVDETIRFAVACERVKSDEAIERRFKRLMNN